LNDWTGSAGADGEHYWHKDLRDIKLSRRREYRLRMIWELRSDSSDGRRAALYLRPRLSGGGNELP
jgi:hypothetical protein